VTQEEALKKLLEEFSARVADILRGVNEPAASSELSDRSLLELLSHEGIVCEAYKDSVGVWTWGVGVTDASGHRVLRYKDNPQPISKVIEIFKWLIATKYLPDVKKAFTVELNEAQLAAALSFHYNTGAIKKASWVKSFNKGDVDKAYQEIMNWRTPSSIIERREKERDLFFNGHWSNDGMATVYTVVNKPSYTPRWSSAERIDITGDL
jgi:GH24 family phage-related lysozyme (muramidase)